MAFVNIEFAQNKSMALVLLRLKRKIIEKKVKRAMLRQKFFFLKIDFFNM